MWKIIYFYLYNCRSEDLRPEAKNFKTFFIHTVSITWLFGCISLKVLKKLENKNM